MPSKADIEWLTEKLEQLISPGMSRAEIDAVFESLDLDTFSEADIQDIERRILSGEAAEFWMDGIEPEGGMAKDDAAKPESRHYEDGEPRMTVEEHDRYMRDIAASYGMTVEEMDDYYEKVAGADESPAETPAVSTEIASMFEDIAKGYNPEGKMEKFVSSEERQALASYERDCRERGVTPNDQERADWVKGWLEAADEHWIAGAEAQHEKNRRELGLPERQYDPSEYAPVMPPPEPEGLER